MELHLCWDRRGTVTHDFIDQVLGEVSPWRVKGDTVTRHKGRACQLERSFCVAYRHFCRNLTPAEKDKPCSDAMCARKLGVMLLVPSWSEPACNGRTARW